MNLEWRLCLKSKEKRRGWVDVYEWNRRCCCCRLRYRALQVYGRKEEQSGGGLVQRFVGCWLEAEELVWGLALVQ